VEKTFFAFLFFAYLIQPVSVKADFENGLLAYKKGDYIKAKSEWLP
jgi:hypothetical protein